MLPGLDLRYSLLGYKQLKTSRWIVRRLTGHEPDFVIRDWQRLVAKHGSIRSRRFLVKYAALYTYTGHTRVKRVEMDDLESH